MTKKKIVEINKELQNYHIKLKCRKYILEMETKKKRTSVSLIA